MSFSCRFQELSAAIADCHYTKTEHFPLSEDQALEEMQERISQIAKQNGIVYVVGNGGSSGIASHFCNDLMKTLGVPSQTLFDSNVMTCLSNDLGYEKVFSYPLTKLLKPADLLIAISSSGQSKNILNAADVARSKNAGLISFTGFQADNPLRQMGHLNFYIPRCDYGLVESAHFFLLHTIIDVVPIASQTSAFRPGQRI
ncbi:MAG TPA: SIS domain-containing protein [Chlamydiales bacterium]|nr:SIS domain-containing protein [Chlamydiales bacterium]